MLSLREVMLFNHKRDDFWLPNFGFKRSLLSLLKSAAVSLRIYESGVIHTTSETA